MDIYLLVRLINIISSKAVDVACRQKLQICMKIILSFYSRPTLQLNANAEFPFRNFDL